LTNDSSVSVISTHDGTSMVTKQSGSPKEPPVLGKREKERIESCKTAIVNKALKVKQQMNTNGKCTKSGFLA